MELNREYFLEVKKRIAPYLKPTPVLRSDKIQKLLGYSSPIYFKLENEQPTGSFKVRAAFNVLLQLPPGVNDVVTYSSGNFAQAVAFGAQKLGKKAHIIMPEDAPYTKIDGTRSLGAE